MHSNFLPTAMSSPSNPVPEILSKGTTLTKISHKKKKKCLVSIDPDQGTINYESRRDGIIPLKSIREIRCGNDARYYRIQFHFSEDDEPRWITLIYLRGSDYKMLHLLADDSTTFNLWRDALTHLHNVRQSLMRGLGQSSLRQDTWTREYWKKANAMRPDAKLDFDEILFLAKQLHTSDSKTELEQMFKAADEEQMGSLSFTGFQRFDKLLNRRPDIEAIYKESIPPTSTSMDLAAFRQFVLESQKAPEGMIDTWWQKYSSAHDNVSSMDLESFTSFLLSSDNSVLNPVHDQVHQDMTRPISDYYISASHNTYLVGHQLVGASTIEGYIRALLMGCKSVELDIYDGDDDEEPMIYHGKTFTSSVSLRDVCLAIAKYAFVVSQYPLVISAEVHCGLEKQEQIYQIMVEVFGDALVRAPIHDRPKIETLPSPEEMRGKILLKAKNLFITAGQQMQMQQQKPNEIPPALEVETESSTSGTDGVVDEIKGIMSKLRGKRKKEKPKMSFALASLLVYTVGVKCRGINKQEKYSPEHIFSLSENAGRRLCGREEFLHHSQTHMVRIYPKGTRVSSSNYRPHTFWATGAQLVAMNVQTFDFGLEMNSTFFQMNGKSGYLLKPEPLRNADVSILRNLKQFRFHCKIISAQHLPSPRDDEGEHVATRSAIDPFVQVSLHIPDWTMTEESVANQSELESEVKSYSTKVMKDNGFNPCWSEDFALTFDCASEAMHPLVFVHFEVKLKHDDEDDAPIAQYCVSLGQLQQGYRHLPLYDSQLSQFLYSSLFVKTSVEAVL